MRVAVSGTHGVGKTTVVEGLCARLGGHEMVPEPYVLLEDDGYEFAHPPGAEDYLAQLRCSVEVLRTSGAAVVFDRSPLDFLAYLSAVGVDPESMSGLAPVRAAMASLDLLVLVPVTAATERILPVAEMPRLRTAMDAALVDLVYTDRWDLVGDLPVVELDGPLDLRVDTVLGALR